MEFTVIDALITSVIGVGVVMSILALIAVLIILSSKAIRAIEAKAKAKAKTDTPVVAPVSTAELSPVSANDREVELINTDEKTAAVIMAIVSQKSGIPVERLSFKSIKLLDNEKKGADAK